MAYQLKPFVINLGDLAFLLKQINFKPLFDANGNAVVNWDGVGSVFTANHTEIIGGVEAGDAASQAAITANGVGFPSTTAPIGIRDVSGYHNNLYGTQAFWGTADEVFRRDVGADFLNYIKPVAGGAYLTSNGGLDSNPYVLGAQAYTAGSDYTTTVDSLGVVTQSNVVDYTPRMISRTITTGGVNLLADANGHYVAWNAVLYADGSAAGLAYKALVDASGVVIANLVEGAKIVAPINTALQLLDAHGDPIIWHVADYGLSAVYSVTLAQYSSQSFGGLFGSATGGSLVDGGQVYIQMPIGTFTPINTISGPLTYDLDLLQYKQLIDASGVSFASLVDNQPIVYATSSQSGYGLLEQLGQIDYQNPTSGEFFIGSENPGVSPVNSWFAIFGQFFDHGLDKLSAGGQGTTVKIALAVDDPLYGVLGSDGQPVTSITINRATVVGADANGDPTFKNSTSPFIDQSQTYGSSDQITNLLREWVSTDNGATFHAGMKLFDGTTLADAWERRWPDGSTTMVHDTLPTLNELRDHVLDTNRAALTWEDVTNLHNRDASGALAAGDSGQPLLLDMNPRFDGAHLDATTAVGGSTVNALIDAAVATLSADAALMGFTFGRVGGGTSGGIELTVTGGAGGPYLPDGVYTGANALALWVNFSNFSITAPAGAVHDAVGQILMAAVGDHYIAGDGRVNENFGLTAIHHVFHEEHNYQVENLKTWIYAHDANNTPGTHAGLHEWQINTGVQDAAGNYIYTNGAGTLDDVIAWDADKMFNGSKLIVEMEYQHAAVDQYARTITPRIQEFVGYSSSVDSTVSLEYAQTAFRFGHSTIRETIDTIDPSGWFKGHVTTYALEAAFLTPQTFADEGVAAITLGLSRQQMNEVDEFITPALNQGLLGQPLDLAAINIARGRDMGIPTLNTFRGAIGLAQYVSWADFGLNMIHPESLVNFIAAYSFDGDVAKATEIMALADGTLTGTGALSGLTVAQAIAFMHNDVSGGAIFGADGFNHMDAWMGGLAEAHVPGGLLGETFDAVFVAQIQALMDGDRFYYLYRLFGTQIGEEVNNGQFKDIVERNTGLSHLNGSIFAYADKYYDFGLNTGATDNFAEHEYANLIDLHKLDANGFDNSGDANVGVGIFSDDGASTANNGAIITVGGIKYINDIRPELDPTQIHPLEGTPTSGANSHEVIVGTAYRDYIEARGGDDTIYGEAGDDILNGGGGIDRIYGGAGDDVIDTGEGPDLADGGAGDDIIYGRGSGSEVGGFDQLVGGGGNDTIIGGEGIDKLSGGAGDDVLFGDGIVFSEMGNTDPFTHGGDGNDYIDGGASGDLLYGDEGDDLVVGAQDQDIVQGNLGDDILRPGNPSQAVNGGPDEVIGDDGYTNNGYDLIDFSDYVAGAGITIDLLDQTNPLVAIDGTTPMPAMFQVEGIIGTQNNDNITGDAAGDATADFSQGKNWLIGGSGNDKLQGNGGNDVIIGDGIRLDSLIGTYSGTYTMYDTYADASHRNSGVLQNNGLLDSVAGFDKHYTEMLSSAIFKDLELGGSAIGELNGVAGTRQGDGGIAGAADTAVFTGNLADYSIERVFYNTAHEGVVTAYVVTDNRPTNQVDANGDPIPTDGTDILVGVEFMQFADGTVSSETPFNVRPDGTLAFTVVENPSGVNNGNNAVRLNPASSLFDANNITGSNPTGAVTTGITYSWLTTGDAPISTNTGANPYVDSAGRLVAHTTAGTIVREKVTYTDGAGNAETVTKDWNLVVGTSNNNSNTPLNGTANSDAIFGLGGSDTLNGNAGDDRLYGGTGNDTLNGGANNDYLDGGSGTNSLRGGSGDDLYVVTSNGDTVDERVYVGNNATNNSDAGGTDTVLSAIDYTLASSTTGNRGAIENLTLTGSGNTNGTGNNLANVITGNAGNNVLNGGAGADTMIGGAGNDTYIVDNTNDVVTENAGAGTDNVQSSASSYTLATNVENLTLTGNGSNNGTGNSGNNTITGNSGSNVLDGAAGADMLVGGQGRDVMTGGVGADVFDFNNTNESVVGVNRDVITDFLLGTDKIDLSGIDARVNGNNSNGNQAFTSLTESTAAFTNAQQLHYHYEGVGVNEVTIIEGNVNSTATNGNGFAADFQIQLTGHVTLNQLTDIVM